MSKIEAVMFDVGGVLHSSQMAVDIRSDIKKHFQLSDETFRRAWEKTSPLLGNGRVTESEFWELFRKEIPTEISLPGESLLVRQYRLNFRSHEDVLKIVEGLKLRRLKLAIFSNNIEPHVKFLTMKGLFQNFAIRVFSNEVGISKPDPRIYIITLDRLGVAPEHSVFVDDKEENIQAANDLGIKGILFIDSGQLKKDLNDFGVSV